MILPKNTQENVLLLLCFDEKNAQLTRNTVSLELFDPPYYRTIAEKAINYIDKYGKPIKEHIADELIGQLAEKDKGEIYKQLLNDMFQSRDIHNSEYIID